MSLQLDWVEEVMSGDSLTVSCFHFCGVCVCWKTIYSGSHGDTLSPIWALCVVYCSPAGSHHMSPLLGPVFLLPGPPWPPAHTLQAADTQRGRGVVWQKSLCMLTPPLTTRCPPTPRFHVYKRKTYFCLSSIYFPDFNKWPWLSCVSKHSRMQENSIISDLQLRQVERDSPPLWECRRLKSMKNTKV